MAMTEGYYEILDDESLVAIVSYEWDSAAQFVNSSGVVYEALMPYWEDLPDEEKEDALTDAQEALRLSVADKARRYERDYEEYYPEEVGVE